MLIHRAEQNHQVSIDYVETAPAAAHRDMYVAADGSIMTGEGASRLGWRPNGVPGPGAVPVELPLADHLTMFLMI